VGFPIFDDDVDDKGIGVVEVIPGVAVAVMEGGGDFDEMIFPCESVLSGNLEILFVCLGGIFRLFSF